MFYKICNSKSPFNLFKVITEKASSYATRNVNVIPLIKIKHNFFKNTFFTSINLICSCGVDIESTTLVFLCCSLFDDKRITLLSTLSKIECKLIQMIESSLTKTPLFDNSLFDLKKTPLCLMHPLITFYPLKDSKNPYSKLLK